MHVYWVLNCALSPTEWYPLAAALVEATVRHGFKCDTAVTTDAARVLRVPQTWNYKTDPPRQVRILSEAGPDYSFEQLDEALTPYQVGATLPKIHGCFCLLICRAVP